MLSKGVRWARANLFRGVGDSLLSVVVGGVLIWGIFTVFEWAVVHAVWSAGSAEECQDIAARRYGNGTSGACWAGIPSFVVFAGFYPPELAWRPILATGVMLGALAGLVFLRSLRARMVVAALLIPCWYGLIWGGWGLEPVSSTRVGGAVLVFSILLFGTTIALPLGGALALGAFAALAPLKWVCRAVIGACRGLPVLVILFAGVVLSPLMLPPGLYLDRVLWVSGLLALPCSAVVAGALWRGLALSSRSWEEAAMALGMTRAAAFRVVGVPLAWRRAGPEIAFAVAALARNASLIVIVGMMDPLSLVGLVRNSASWPGMMWEPFVVGGLFYGLLSYGITSYGRYLWRALREQGHTGLPLPQVVS